MKSPLSVRTLAQRLGLSGALGALAMIVLCALVPTAGAMAAPAGDQATKCGKTDTQCVITAGNKLIAARLTALTTLSGKVTEQLNAKHITSDQANAIQADLTTNQNNLKSLQTKLDAEKNAEAARADAKNILFEFRIFAVVLPRDYQKLHLAIERQLDAKLVDAKAKIEKAIAKAPADKRAQLNTLYTDYKAQLAKAEGQFDTIQSTLPTLTPANFNQNRTTYEANLKTMRADEKTAHTALHQAAKDLHQISQILKGTK